MQILIKPIQNTLKNIEKCTAGDFYALYVSIFQCLRFLGKCVDFFHTFGGKPTIMSLLTFYRFLVLIRPAE
jgi:hypothetical protein